MNHGPFVKLTTAAVPAKANFPGMSARPIYLRSFDIARVWLRPDSAKVTVKMYDGDAIYVEETLEVVVALIQAAEGPERLRWRGPLGMEG